MRLYTFAYNLITFNCMNAIFSLDLLLIALYLPSQIRVSKNITFRQKIENRDTVFCHSILRFSLFLENGLFFRPDFFTEDGPYALEANAHMGDKRQYIEILSFVIRRQYYVR